jgi:2-polyprenyl-6-methoxyphenol hydroxylase-like FAD-dependent oxidoreductase
MSPVGGVGINYAIQDAVVTANILSKALKAGNVKVIDLAKVQHKRELPTRIIQAFQSLIQQRILAPLFNSNQTFKPPLIVRLPVFRSIPLRLIAFGICPVHVKPGQ